MGMDYYYFFFFIGNVSLGVDCSLGNTSQYCVTFTSLEQME